MWTCSLARVRFYRRVLSYFLPNWGWLLLLLMSIGTATFMGLLQVWPLALLVDVVLAPANSSGGGRLHAVVRQWSVAPQVLHHVSLQIAPGEMVAFVGPSGCGKTTLMNLLPRFHDPDSGVMRLDQHDARQVRLRDLRSHIALALQESTILPTTIGENIAYGRASASREEILQAAVMSGAAEFIERMPNGLDTVIGEGGVNLSGGQRQRIAIARALLTGAPILVLDEPSSALDPVHEQHLRETLKQIQGTRTIILVSHRMNSVVDCDRIYVLDQGRITEQGTHQELLALDGSYCTLAGRRSVSRAA